jgi:hypothetical protein
MDDLGNDIDIADEFEYLIHKVYDVIEGFLSINNQYLLQ